MGLRTRKMAPGFNERFNVATSLAGAAVSLFEVAASDLEDAALDLEELAAEAAAESDRLMDFGLAAQEQAESNAAAARNIRRLVATK